MMQLYHKPSQQVSDVPLWVGRTHSEKWSQCNHLQSKTRQQSGQIVLIYYVTIELYKICSVGNDCQLHRQYYRQLICGSIR